MAEVILLSDLDGTLVDYREHHLDIFYKALKMLGFQVRDDERVMKDCYGLLNDLGIGRDCSDFWRGYSKFDDRVGSAERGLIRLFDDTVEFLEHLQAYRWAVVSDTQVQKAWDEIRALGIDHLIPLMFNCSSAQDQKPNILLGLNALASLGHNGEPVCVVGDMVTDIVFAKNLEARLIADGSSTKVYSVLVHSASGEADHVAQNLTQAYEFLEGLKKK